MEIKMRKDGGPAFPKLRGGVDTFGSISFEHEGMTLRDWFAGKALGGGADEPEDGESVEDYAMRVAMTCYKLADAMLKARGS